MNSTMVFCKHLKLTPLPALSSPHLYPRRSPTPYKSPLFSPPSPNPLLQRFPAPRSSPLSPHTIPDGVTSLQDRDSSAEMEEPRLGDAKTGGKSFWAAIGLIIGTAVGPGMLGLPSATIRSGPVPSTAAIILSWVYVVSSIILVAELSFAAMEEGGVEEVSFTALATNTLGANFGALVAVVYASLSFSLMIACVSGIGSLVAKQFPSLNPITAHVIFPGFVGTLIGFFSFKAIDATNRLLCGLMLLSITALVAIGFSVGRNSMLGSLAYACWRPEMILPAIPVTVLTLGFHVVTPFVCKIVGDTVYDARNAILIGGAVPLLMVLSWNLVILGLAGPSHVSFDDPIKLLLSVNPSALPAVQGFAFAALATSLIGYAVSFPKQLADTLDLIAQRFVPKKGEFSQTVGRQTAEGEICREGGGFRFSNGLNQEGTTAKDSNRESTSILTWFVLVVPVFIASFFSAAFSKALDFAGVYANCVLFGILPPAMAWIHRSRKRQRSSCAAAKEDILPGGNAALLVLFGIAVTLAFWH